MSAFPKPTRDHDIEPLIHQVRLVIEYPRQVVYELLTNWQPFPNVKAASSRIQIVYASPLLVYISSTLETSQVLDFASTYDKDPANYYSLFMEITSQLQLETTPDLTVRLLSTQVLTTSILPPHPGGSTPIKPPKEEGASNLNQLIDRVAKLERLYDGLKTTTAQITALEKLASSNHIEIVTIDRRVDRLAAETATRTEFDETKALTLALRNSISHSFNVIADSAKNRTSWFYHAYELIIARLHHMAASFHDRQACDAGMILIINTAILTRVAADAGAAPTDAEWRAGLANIIKAFISNGTSPMAMYENVTIHFGVTEGHAIDIPLIAIAQMIRIHTRVRRYAAYYADLAKTLAATMDIGTAILNKHGIPYAYKYLCFDFTHGLKNLTPDEQGVISAARSVALHRSQTSKLLNVSAEYTRAILPSTGASSLN